MYLKSNVRAPEGEAACAETTVMLTSRGLTEDDVRAIVTDVVNSISTWRDEARRIGISIKETNRMATAFEHDEMVAGAEVLRSVS